MINREYRPVTIITYENGIDEYGQKRKKNKTERTTEMVVKINSQVNVNDPRYIDCDYIGITKDKDIKDTDTCSFDNKNCNIKYIIPSGKYNQILIKVNKE